MIQFVFGIAMAVFQMYYSYDCVTPADKFCIWFLGIYIIVLFFLFGRFYHQRYSKTIQKHKEQ